jgi:hypothetical protein
MGFGLVNRSVDHLRVITTNNYYTIADFQTTNHTKLIRLLTPYLVTAPHNGYSSAVSSLDVFW